MSGMVEPDHDLAIPGLSGWERIGRGGFGIVYRARDDEHARMVAVKVLDAPHLDARARRMFEGERTTMGRLSGHPNIVTVYRSGFTATGRPYIVMDYMAGGSYEDRLQERGPVPWPEAAEACIKIAGALEAAHRTDVLHRDIKPANILLTAWGEPKLGDFGIARIASATLSTATGVSASVAYAAPEVLDGRPASPASDIYSLGCSLHALVAGGPPFVREGDESLLPVIARVLSEPPPDLRPLGVPEAVAGVSERALAKQPVERFPTAHAFGAALQRALTDAGRTAPAMVPDLGGEAGASVEPPDAAAVAAPAPSAPSALATDLPKDRAIDGVTDRDTDRAAERTRTTPARPSRGGRDRRRAVAAAVLAVLALAVIGGVALLADPGRPPPATPPAENDPTEPSDTPSGRADEQVDPRLAAIAGSIAFLAHEGQKADIVELSVAQGRYGPITAGVDAGPPALSPDGRSVAFATDGDLFVIDLQTADSRRVVAGPGQERDPAWSPDSTRLAYASDAAGSLDLYVVDAAGGEPSQVTGGPGDEGSPSWSPDGEVLAYDTDEAGSFDVWLVHVDGTGSRQLTSGREDDRTPAYAPDGTTVAFVRRAPSGEAAVYLVDTAGDERVQRLTGDQSATSGPAWSPDGAAIAYSTALDGDGDVDLYALLLEDRSAVPLVRRPGADTDPSWAR